MKTIILTLLFISLSYSSSLKSTIYDNYIKQSVNRYWNNTMPIDWKYYKSQLYQESLLSPVAVSPVGAQGIAQFMPYTKKEVWNELGFDDSISAFVPYYAILGGAYYMKKQYNVWKSKRPIMDRYYLALASYNAGAGNIIKAQKACGMAVLYDDIIKCLPSITGRHSNETITYVRRIKQWYQQIK